MLQLLETIEEGIKFCYNISLHGSLLDLGLTDSSMELDVSVSSKSGVLLYIDKFLLLNVFFGPADIGVALSLVVLVVLSDKKDTSVDIEEFQLVSSLSFLLGVIGAGRDIFEHFTGVCTTGIDLSVSGDLKSLHEDLFKSGFG